MFTAALFFLKYLKMLSPVFLASVLSAVRAYSICSRSDVTGPITIPITNVLVASPIRVSGNIEIVDGCTVRLLRSDV